MGLLSGAIESAVLLHASFRKPDAVNGMIAKVNDEAERVSEPCERVLAVQVGGVDECVHDMGEWKN